MIKESCFSSHRLLQFLLITALILTPISCRLFSTDPSHYDNPAFSFDYPTSWQTMDELWGTEHHNENYAGFGFNENIMVTSARKKGQFGAYFAVATKALSEGESLDTVFQSTYSQIEDQIRNVSETTTNLNGIPVFVKDYERASGEPWWRYHDLWLEKDGTIYLLSFHCLGSIEKYQEDLDFMLTSFSFK